MHEMSYFLIFKTWVKIINYDRTVTVYVNFKFNVIAHCIGFLYGFRW